MVESQGRGMLAQARQLNALDLLRREHVVLEALVGVRRDLIRCGDPDPASRLDHVGLRPLEHAAHEITALVVDDHLFAKIALKFVVTGTRVHGIESPGDGPTLDKRLGMIRRQSFRFAHGAVVRDVGGELDLIVGIIDEWGGVTGTFQLNSIPVFQLNDAFRLFGRRRRRRPIRTAPISTAAAAHSQRLASVFHVRIDRGGRVISWPDLNISLTLAYLENHCFPSYVGGGFRYRPGDEKLIEMFHQSKLG